MNDATKAERGGEGGDLMCPALQPSPIILFGRKKEFLYIAIKQSNKAITG